MHTWIFDLDDTLHHASPFIFPHLNQLMTQYLQNHLDLSQEDAQNLRIKYWHQYGATLLGLIKHHDVDPDHFLWNTHQFKNLNKMIVKQKGLIHTLNHLKGKKYIFSNAPKHYIEWILKLLNIRRFFSGVHGLEDANYIPKPYKVSFYSLIHRYKINPKNATFVEDSAPNLKFAKILGMRTILLSKKQRKSSYIDKKITKLINLRKFKK